jgi:seryl-tRNA synthetase
MEVKTEPLNSECEKYRKLQQDYAILENEIMELRKVNTELQNEMARKDQKNKRQNDILIEEMVKLKGKYRELEKQQSQKMMMENSVWFLIKKSMFNQFITAK